MLNTRDHHKTKIILQVERLRTAPKKDWRRSIAARQEHAEPDDQDDNATTGEECANPIPLLGREEHQDHVLEGVLDPDGRLGHRAR